MKDFFKYMLATMCGILVMTIIGGLLLALTITGLMAGSDSKVKAKENSVFVLKLNGMVSERSEDAGPLSLLLGAAEADDMGLDDILKAIRQARDEENIKGIYLEGGATVFDSPATAQQVRDALADFRKSGKWVYAYGDQMMQASYYVCSVADSVFLNATGMIDFKGLGGKSMYMTGLYEKLGVKYQAARVGKYKSYVESVTRKDMSAEDREQREAYLNGIWSQWTEQIAQSRQTTAEALNQLANDSIMIFATTTDYQKAHLIDRAFYPEEMQQVVRRQLGIGKDDDLHLLTLKDMKNLKPAKKVKEKGDEIAVYYAYGEIIDELVSGFMSEHSIVGRTVSDDLRRLADDEKVKAVVMRVNSGGGSAIASEQIWHAIKQLKTKKPIVVSMGGMAASGGYMISCGANYIFAEPSTITGSIGIFGLVPNFSGLISDKLGITMDGVTTNRYSDFENDLIFGSENSDAMRNLQGYTDRGYVNFLDIVADGRQMTRDNVDSIAQGRVWLATDALGIGLVDKLGSLDDAIKKAAELANMQEYHTCAYPAKKSWSEGLFSDDDEQTGSYLDKLTQARLQSQLRMVLGDLYEPYLQLRLDQLRNRLQARLPFSVSVE
ncbi:MAG: signal peptide peptidase SppA [Prevotella sp.]|jgi:protease-4|nr:signal peptide peptidase SppA [Prevotella sp.]